METSNIFEINKYFTLIEEEFLKVFGYNNKNLTFNDIVKNINIILERMGEVSITQQPNKQADTEPKAIGNLVSRVKDNKLWITSPSNRSTVYVIPVLTGSKKEIMIYKKGSSEGYQRAVVGDISKNLNISPAELKSILKSTTVPTLYEELVSNFKLEPLIEDTGKARGRPRKPSMLESPPPVNEPTIAKIPIKTPKIQSPPSPEKAITTPEQSYVSKTGTLLESSSYSSIDKNLKNALSNASHFIRNPDATGPIIERSFMNITKNLFPQNIIDTEELRFIPNEANKALVVDVAKITDKAIETGNPADIQNANRGFEKILEAIRKGRKGFGIKRKSKSFKSKPKVISKADKLRINLLVGELQAGNNHPDIYKEVKKFQKKYNK